MFLVGDLAKFSLFSPDVHIYWSDAVLLILGGIILSSKRQVSSKLKHFFTYLFPFLFACLLSLVFNFNRFGILPVMTGALYLFRFFVYSTVWLIILQLIKPNQYPKLILTISLLFTATGLVQYFFFPDLRSLGMGWDPHYYRLVGTLLDPGFTGLILVFILLFLTLYPPMFNPLAWTGAFLALALTYSRASFLAFLVSMTVIAVSRKSAKFFLLIILLLGLTIWLLPRPGGEGVRLERTSTVLTRLSNWQSSFTIFSANPLIGVGFNQFRYAQRAAGYLDSSDWLSSHSGAGSDMSLLFVTATTGAVGLAAYLYYLYRLFIIPNLLLLTSLVALIVHSFFLNSQFFPQVLLWLGLLIAWAIFDTPPSTLFESGSPKRPTLQTLGHSHLHLTDK